MSDQPSGEFLLYETEDGKTRVGCRFAADTLWLTQALMADLFQVTVPTINEHLKTIFAEGELLAEATIRKFLIVRQEGSRQVSRNLDHYNLDAILAVGYRVRSACGTQFRRWATERLREYLVKGFTMDDERLKNPPVGASVAPDYFDQLLGRILLRSRRFGCDEGALKRFENSASYREDEKPADNRFVYFVCFVYYGYRGATSGSTRKETNRRKTSWQTPKQPSTPCWMSTMRHWRKPLNVA